MTETQTPTSLADVLLARARELVQRGNACPSPAFAELYRRSALEAYVQLDRLLRAGAEAPTDWASPRDVAPCVLGTLIALAAVTDA